jgi:hypothetical protein
MFLLKIVESEKKVKNKTLLWRLNRIPGSKIAWINTARQERVWQVLRLY